MTDITNQFNLSERELATLTSKEILDSHVDVLGVTLGLERANLGTLGYKDPVAATPATATLAPAFLLEALEAEISAIPGEAKSAFLEARAKCPDLVDDVHKTKFLRREDLDHKRAARRLVKYWEAKKEDFGPEKMCLPLTLRGALRDDLVALSSGLWSVLPFKDEAGRSIIFIDTSRYDPTKHSRESMLRAGWYVHHVANEDPDVIDNGFVYLVTSRNSGMFDPIMATRGVRLVRDAYPFNLRACHHCHPGASARIVAPLLPLFGLFFKLRLRMYFGSDEEVLHQLASCNIPRERVPTVLRGDFEIKTNQWLLERLVKEEVSAGAFGQTSIASPLVSAFSSSQIQAATAQNHHMAHSQDPKQYLGALRRGRLLLYTPEDDSHLSELLCMVRAQIEVFAATQADVDARGPRGGRTCRISVGRVGLRCANCAHLPFHERTNASVAFPASIKNVYQSSRNFKRDHFVSCRCIPPHVKESMARLGEKRKNSTGVMEYVEESCKRLGMADTEDGSGIKFV